MSLFGHEPQGYTCKEHFKSILQPEIFHPQISKPGNIFGNFFILMYIRVIQISNFCIQTGNVRHWWKFLVANWTELALQVMSLWSTSKTDA